MFQIDPLSRIPVYEQIVMQSEQLVAREIVKPGDALPSVRSLSIQLGINPNTIQKAYTELYVKFDGETEVNDYMDTYGKLKVAYAVELENAGKTTNKVSGATSTGDDSNLLMLIAIMTLAALLALLTIMSWLRDRKEGEQE